MKLFLFLIAAGAFLCGWGAPTQYFVEPDAECEITLTDLAAGDDPAYLIRDYGGRQTGGGTAEISEGQFTVRHTFPAGYHELEFPQAERRIGIVALPAYRGEFDEFWGINTIFLVKAVSGGQQALFSDLALQEDYLKVLARSGIGEIREMAAFYLRAPQENAIDFEGGHWLRLRELAQQYGIRVLTFHEHFPEWTGTDRPHQVQPTQLDRFAGPFEVMLQREAATAAGVQVFNEGDVERKCAPPDGTAALTRLTRLLLDRNGLDTPLVGMAFCYPRPPLPLLRNYAENGYFAEVDVMAFNYYDAPEKLGADLEANVSAIAGLSQRLPALWMTESGRAWPQGTRRPTAEADRTSADWIIRKAITARAFGVSRHYAFCLPFFDEGKNNFGMFDCNSTPLRGFAVYAAAAGLLSGKQYIGDLRQPPAGVASCPVFSDGKTAVAVLVSQSGAISLQGMPAAACYGIDGSAAKPNANGVVTPAGKLLYLELPHRRLVPLVQRDTPAMRVAQLLRERQGAPEAALPVILRHHFETQPRRAQGYWLDRSEFTVGVTAFNFSDQPVAIDLLLQIDEAEPIAFGAVETLPPQGQREFSLPVSVAGDRDHELRIFERNGQCHSLFLQFTRRPSEEKETTP